jgi:acyl-CoA thioester hydrolase
MSLTPPEGFRHHILIQVRWGDMDALGHVNNAKYLSYLELARIDYCETLSLWNGDLSSTGLIMARIELDYKLPLTAGDDVHVFTRCSRLGNRSLDTEQLIVRVEDGTLHVAAQSTITVVAYDYQTNRSTPIPSEWRARICKYEPRQIAQ